MNQDLASFFQIQAQPQDAGKRLDRFLTEKLPEHSRSRIQDWIENQRVLLNGEPRRASYLLRGNETIDVSPSAPPPLRASPENIDLNIIYEDDSFTAIDKPAGMVVHAGAGAHSGTLVNALLHRFQNLSGVGGDLRPGIVHRLDRFTSGVILVAKNDAAHRNLAHQFASRQVRKIYLALAHGRMEPDVLRVEKPITRDPKRRERMTARLAIGRAAWSEFTVLHRYPGYTYLQALIGTGRTHQIRVHLSSAGFPIVGDKLYGAPESSLGRYFLHAHSIGFLHPRTGEPLRIESPLPPELAVWLARVTPGEGTVKTP